MAQLGIALAATAGSALLGQYFGRGDRKASKSARQANIGRLNRATAIGEESKYLTDRAVGQIGTLVSGVPGQVKAGFAQARSEIGRVGTAGRQNILDRESQALASNEQSASQRGLGNTSVLDAGARGVRLDTNRTLMEFDERIALLRSGVIERGTTALAQASLGTAGALSQNAALQMRPRQDLMRLLGSVQDVATPSGGAQAGGQLGALLGMLMMSGIGSGGGGGGGLGASSGSSFDMNLDFDPTVGQAGTRFA